MAERGSDQPDASRQARGSLRLLGVVTLLVTASWAAAAWWVYDRYIPRRRDEAILMTLFASGMHSVAAPSRPGLGHSNHQQAPGIASLRLDVIELTRGVWFGMMVVVASSLFIAGVAGLTRSRHARRAHQAAALLIIVSTIGTLVGLVVLINKGGFPPTPRPLLYVLIVLVQSAYGWILALTLTAEPGRQTGPDR